MLGAIAGAAGAFMSSGAGQSMLAGLGNAFGGMANSATGYYYSKKMAQYNYDLQKKGYQEFPTAQVEGLRAAGINPMIAYGGMSGATAHAQNYTSGSDSRAGSSAIEAYQKAKQNQLAEQSLTSQIDVNSATAEKARKEGEAAMMNAQTNRMSVDKMAPRDPNNDLWAKGDYFLNKLGDLTTTAFGGKMLYDWWKNKGSTPAGDLPLPKNTPGIGSKKPPKPISSKPTSANSAKGAKEVLKKVGKYAAPAAAAAGAIYAGEKARETIKKDKKSDYNRGHKNRVPNAFGIPNYWQY